MPSSHCDQKAGRDVYHRMRVSAKAQKSIKQNSQRKTDYHRHQGKHGIYFYIFFGEGKVFHEQFYWGVALIILAIL